MRSQTQAVYRAEAEFRKREIRFTSRAEAEDMVRRIIKSKWWASQCRIREIEISWRNYEWHWCKKDEKRIGLMPLDEPEFAPTPSLICHELAHLLYWEKRCIHHPRWVWACLSLVGKWLGAKARRQLELEYAAEGITWEKPSSAN